MTPIVLSLEINNKITHTFTSVPKKLIAGIENIKHKCIIKLLCVPGLRLSELLYLELNAIDSNNMIIHHSRKSKKHNRIFSLYTRNKYLF